MGGWLQFANEMPKHANFCMFVTFIDCEYFVAFLSTAVALVGSERKGLTRKKSREKIQFAARQVGPTDPPEQESGMRGTGEEVDWGVGAPLHC